MKVGKFTINRLRPVRGGLAQFTFEIGDKHRVADVRVEKGNCATMRIWPGEGGTLLPGAERHLLDAVVSECGWETPVRVVHRNG